MEVILPIVITKKMYVSFCLLETFTSKKDKSIVRNR